MILHFNAVKARLSASSKLAGKVNDSVLDTATGLPFKGSYVVLFGGEADSLESNRFTASQRADSDAEYVYTVRSVATTAAGVRLFQGEVGAQLKGHRLVVAGRSCSPARLTDSTDPVQDAKSLLFFADQEFTLISRRSS